MYMKVEWIHNFPSEPVLIYSEIDELRNEHRKIELFSDGNIGYAHKERENGGSGLSKCPLPEIDQINSDLQFKAYQITKDEFELVWLKRVNNTLVKQSASYCE